MLVVTKDEVRESNSHYAQGGIAGVLDPEDRFDNHIADTLSAGKGLCDPEIVEMVVREAPDRIAELIGWGTHFDEVDGHVVLGLRRGPFACRIVHALGDETGREIMRAVIAEGPSPVEHPDLAEQLHDRPVHPRRAVPRRAGLGSPSRLHAGLGQGRRAGDRRGGAALSRNDQPADRHGRRPRHGLSGGRRAARHGVHAVSSDGALHCRLDPPPHDRSPARRRGLPARLERRAVHARLPSAGRAGPRDDVSLAIAAQMAKTSTPTSISTSRTSTPSGFASGFPGSTGSAASSTWTSPATRSPSAPGPTT